MRISDWSSDVCSSDLKGMSLQSFAARRALLPLAGLAALTGCGEAEKAFDDGYKTQFVESFTKTCQSSATKGGAPADVAASVCQCAADELVAKYGPGELLRSEEHTSELQSLMRISYAVFCLKKKQREKTRTAEN